MFGDRAFITMNTTWSEFFGDWSSNVANLRGGCNPGWLQQHLAAVVDAKIWFRKQHTIHCKSSQGIFADTYANLL